MYDTNNTILNIGQVCVGQVIHNILRTIIVFVSCDGSTKTGLSVFRKLNSTKNVEI